MELHPTGIAGVVEICGRVIGDRRGSFVKIFHQELFEKAGVDFRMAEQYWSNSHKDVIRGMHFQLPPHDHGKLVYCVAGTVLDVVVDLRKGSASFGKSEAFELTSENGRALYIPPGLAHGFAGLSDESIMIYNVTSVYHPESDTGIRWDSFGFAWPVTKPILSDRDMRLVPLVDFTSPFVLREA